MSTKSRVLATLLVILVASVTICVKQKAEHKLRKSSDCCENGERRIGVVFHVIFGKLKSPSRNMGQEGKREVTMLIASCRSSTNVGDEEGDL